MNQEVEGKSGKDLSNIFLRYFVGHRGKYGREFIEFSFESNGVLKYINDSSYKKDGSLSDCFVCEEKIIETVRNLIQESGIFRCNDANWPLPNQGGRQELEIAINDVHYSFVTSKINSTEEAKSCEDPQGVATFYKFVQDIRSLFNALVQIHRQASPV
ncbi:hypothetical protein XU18_0138 [Perkinsela sp. CCAP 1560/4]|nr:hypothetical protein XU18_0138 [Perkinsela sp. CCAP 1560/4]|eukprot:KNH09453.1 hypothetical protein XU18_0138 [Perkinsela sp. CCAP 1560/4]